MVAPDDSRLKTEKITFPGASGESMGYLARPADASGSLPAVLVIPENRGLNPPIEDVTRRLALEGFFPLGVDFPTPAGGPPPDEDPRPTSIATPPMAPHRPHTVATVDFLR